MRGMFFILFLLVSFQVANGQSNYWAKYLDNGENNRELLQMGPSVDRRMLVNGAFEEYRYPEKIIEHQPLGSGEIVEIYAKKESTIRTLLVLRGVKEPLSARESFDDREEVITLVDNGPSENRIDLVFMGDGYTQAEKDKFFEDAKRLTKDMFEGDTFQSYLPLFNVHAVFKASNDSGIGKGSSPKDTAYGLYREGNTLRAIFATNTSAARRSCAQAPGCDYPILMANDPYYGGLGGEFAITTSSPTSGTKVLRHELGHNFGRVGEEYDGGGYFGANNSSSLSSLKWKHWLSEERVEAQKSRAAYIDWPWHLLKEGPFTAAFSTNGDYKSFEIQYSASGIETDDTLSVTLDGQKIDAKSPGHSDRAFSRIKFEDGLSNGSHRLVFKENVQDGNNWLSNLAIYEYGSDYNFDPKNVGAYPVVSRSGFVMGYRATHETCLMRNMDSRQFCPICQENNWLQFFSKVSMIDDVVINRENDRASVELQIPPLGQFRDGGEIGDEHVSISWIKDGSAIESLKDQKGFSLPLSQAQGSWRVDVAYVTGEVRKDSQELLKETKRFDLR